MDIENRDSKIVFRDYLGCPHAGLVWGVGTSCVNLCSEDQFEMLDDGEMTAPAIDFPFADVFNYNELIEDYTEGHQFDWQSLQPLCVTATK